MSFSKPKPQKPFNKTIKWKGSDGGSFVYYDGQNNIEIEIDEFIVLDELFSISGWNDDKNKGVWSNEVSDLKREEMAVRIGNDVSVKGVYGDVKDKVKSIGGKFTNVVYALIGEELVRILFSGSGCSGWIGKEFNPASERCGVKFSGAEEGKKGAVVFFTPLFERVELADKQVAVSYTHLTLPTIYSV